MFFFVFFSLTSFFFKFAFPKVFSLQKNVHLVNNFFSEWPSRFFQVFTFQWFFFIQWQVLFVHCLNSNACFPFSLLRKHFFVLTTPAQLQFFCGLFPEMVEGMSLFDSLLSRICCFSFLPSCSKKFPNWLKIVRMITYIYTDWFAIKNLRILF